MFITENFTLQAQEQYLKSAFLKEQNKLLTNKKYRDTVINETINNGYCLKSFFVPLIINKTQKDILCNFIYYVEYYANNTNYNERITIDYSKLCLELNKKYNESPKTCNGFYDKETNSVFVFIELALDLYNNYSEKNYISHLSLFKDDMLGEFESKYNVFLHELVHAFDYNIERNNSITKFNNPKDWWFLGMPKEKSDIIKKAYYILYRYWEISEFNAWEYTSEDDKQIELNLKELKECDDEDVWTIILNIAKSNKFLLKKISNYSPFQFKSFFIKQSEYLIDKFNKRLQKNIYQNKETEKEINRLSVLIYNQIVEFIKNKTSNKNDNFDLVFKFDLFFPKINNVYDVIVYFDIKNRKQSTREKWEINNNIIVSIPKIKYNKTFDIFSFQYNKSYHCFYELYKQLTNHEYSQKLKTISNYLANEFVFVIPSIVD